MLCGFCKYDIEETPVLCDHCSGRWYCCVECQRADVAHRPVWQITPDDSANENLRFLHSYLSKHAPLLIRHALSLFGFTDMGHSIEAQEETIHEYKYSTRFNHTFAVKLYKDPANHRLTFSDAYMHTTPDDKKDKIKSLLANYHPSSFIAVYSIVDSPQETAFSFVHGFQWPLSPIPLFTHPDLTAALHQTEAALLADDSELAENLTRMALEYDEIQPAIWSDDDDNNDPISSDDSLKWEIASSAIQMESVRTNNWANYPWGH